MRLFALLLLAAGGFLLLAAWRYQVQGVSVLGVLSICCSIKLVRQPTK
jgi:hypothetical protein